MAAPNPPYTHDPDAGLEPAFAAPPQACDAHFHVFGPAGRYPYGSDLRYNFQRQIHLKRPGPFDEMVNSLSLDELHRVKVTVPSPAQV